MVQKYSEKAASPKLLIAPNGRQLQHELMKRIRINMELIFDVPEC